MIRGNIVAINGAKPDINKVGPDSRWALRSERGITYATVPPRTMPEAMVVTDKEATNMLLNLQYSYRKNRVSITLADYRNDLVEALALQMLNKRLNDLAEGANPPFAYAGVGMDNLIHGYKAFSAAALPTNNDVQLATSALTGELLKAEQFGFNGSELEIAAKNLQSAYEQAYNERNTTESARLVEEYVGVFLNNDAFPGIANEFAYVKQLLPGIKVAEVNEVVKQWLADKNYFALLTAPENAEIKLPGDKQLLEMMQQGFKQEVVRQADKKVAKTLLETKPAPGTITNVHREDDFGAVTYTLSNGIKVTVKPTVFNTDAIIMKGVKKGGASNYGAADKANVNYTCDIISTMGAGQYTPTQIGEILSGKPVSVSTSINDITSEVDGSSNVKDFESLMQLTYLQLTQPRRDERLFAAFRDKLSSNVKYLRQSPQQAFIDTAVKSICDNHPMVNIVVPNEADVASLSIDRVLSIYSEQFRSADGYHFFIVGNVDTAKIAPLLATYLGSIPATGKQPAYADNGVRVKKGLNRLNFSKGKEKMSMILQVYDAQVPYSEALSMQVNALAEILNIKVIETLREKMGAVYSGGFSAKVSKEPVEKCNLTLYLPCGPENVDTLLAATAAEIEHIKTVGPDYADVEKVKRQWLEKYKTDVKENSYWLGKMVAAFFWDKDRSRIFDYEIYLSKLTPAQIQETARKVFTGNNQFTAILYPEGINKDIKR
ncbi:MAG: insulinase family protein [Chitinophagia bacterium]|nr:insulinase family protein [Chitinophagia bacterium]